MNGIGAKIDFECGKLLLADVGKAPREHSDSDAEHEALTIFVKGKEGRSPQPNWTELQQANERLLASTARALSRVEQNVCQSLELPSRHSSKFTGLRSSGFV